MSPSAAPPVANHGRHNAIEMMAMATDPNVKCFLLYATSVAKTPRFRSNPAKANQCIVASATIKSNLADKANLH